MDGTNLARVSISLIDKWKIKRFNKNRFIIPKGE